MPNPGRTSTARSRFGNALPFPTLGVTTKTSYTGTPAQSGALVATLVRVLCTTDAWIAIGTNPTADTSTSIYCAAKTAYFFPIQSGNLISAIQVASGGDMFITLCTDVAP